MLNLIMEIQSESSLFTSADELTEANRQAGWRIEYRQLMPGVFSSEYAVRGCTDFLVIRERFHSSLEICGEPPQDVMTGIITGNPDKGGKMNGEDVGERRFFIMLPGSELDVSILGGIEAYSFFFPIPQFFEAARQAKISSLIECRGQVLSFQAKASQLKELRRVMSACVAEDTQSADNLAWQTLASNLAMNLVTLISHAADGSQGLESYRCDMKKMLLRRAREYIEAHIQHPIIMADVCSHAGVGVRTLQRLFQRELNISPTRYILARRLAAVRRRLSLRGPVAYGVTRVALDHGFVHLGRFAGEYRRYFGETPSATLKNSRLANPLTLFG